jgi:hypothetical protein
VIEAEKAIYTVSRMCGLLEVSRSGFYTWRQSRDGGPSPSRPRRAELDAKVADFHQASDGVYGAPRILADLRSGASGAGLSSNRTWSTVSSSPTIRWSCTRSSMSLACITIRRRKPWCCVWTRRAACRPWTAPSRCCR